ncbi:MAG: NADP-dependent isocitrate dehydrogenase [Bacteroidia bacterium]|nr:NADP-dependent isocitrate dehydrogenase [Bacteroidia bacterium]
MQTKTIVGVAHGDGIGPEIMEAVLHILHKAGASIQAAPVRMGKQVYESGVSAGIDPSAWELLHQHPILLKAPVTTPQGGGYKSLNVTLRKSLSLFANVRPVRAFSPYVPTISPKMDLVIIRENEEDLYAGIEHQQTADVVQCLKLITRPGCEKIIRYAFEYTRAQGRKKLTCMTKDNIMKQTDGLFHQVFREIGAEYPEIEQDHMIIDIGAAYVAQRPEQFDVIVLPNLYGDIVSDIAAQVAGSVGLAGSANIGPRCAMFEAIHGSAPDIAGRGIANPSGLLQAACMMLQHIGQGDVAARISNAWLATLEDGIHTADIFRDGFSRAQVGTMAFANAVVDRLGESPQHLRKEVLTASAPIIIPPYQRAAVQKTLVGVDLFLDWVGEDPQALGQVISNLAGPEMQLKMITNRGVKVYPEGLKDTFCTDHWRCRFVSAKATVATEVKTYSPISYQQILDLCTSLHQAGFDIVKSEHLYEFDGVRGFSLGQGE